LFVVLDVFLILLSARIAFIGMILLHVGIAFDLFVFRKQYLKSLSLLLLITIVVFGASNIKTFNQRYQNIDKRTTIAQQGSQKKVSDSLSQRSFIYSNIFELIKRNLVIGYGTGDSRMALEDFYNEKNVSFGRYLNAHNQFLQTAVAVGALGLLCLMMCFVSYLFGFLGKNTYVFLFAIALI
jgi:O-antigen ligase